MPGGSGWPGFGRRGRAAIVRSLQGKAIEPQAVVTISKNLSNTVTLGGEVAAGARVPLTEQGRSAARCHRRRRRHPHFRP